MKNNTIAFIGGLLYYVQLCCLIYEHLLIVVEHFCYRRLVSACIKRPNPLTCLCSIFMNPELKMRNCRKRRIILLCLIIFSHLNLVCSNCDIQNRPLKSEKYVCSATHPGIFSYFKTINL